MERTEQPPQQVLRGGGSSSGGGSDNWFMPVSVMTEEQIETLAKQIAAYGTICELLKNTYRNLISSAPHDPQIATLGNLYSIDSTAGGMGYGIPRSKRWNATKQQLQILESIFEEKNQPPPRERIKEITADLAKHGKITEENVYNWFQNRRARFKKRQVPASMASSHDQPVVQNIVETPVKISEPVCSNPNLSAYTSDLDLFESDGENFGDTPNE